MKCIKMLKNTINQNLEVLIYCKENSEKIHLFCAFRDPNDLFDAVKAKVKGNKKMNDELVNLLQHMLLLPEGDLG